VLDLRPLGELCAATSEESSLSGIFIVLVIVLGADPSSSGSASTVTRIFHGLKFCSETARNGQELPKSSRAPPEAVRTFFGRRTGLFEDMWLSDLSSSNEVFRGSGELKSSW
jgi:hypothetical protein